MTPWRAWKLYRSFSKIHHAIEETSMKQFWKSKTIWFQILTILTAVTGVVNLPADVTAAIVAGINVALRLVTSQGVST